jgi:hypothetical protein
MRRILLAAALPILLGGCYVAGRGTVAYEASPPPPRVVVVDARPGYVWVDGHWSWNYNRWYWNNGYYLVDRPGYTWIQGSYYGRRYRPGYWHPGVYHRPSGNSQAGQAVRGGLREAAPSRAGQVTSPVRQQPSRVQQAPSSSGRVRVRDHR